MLSTTITTTEHYPHFCRPEASEVQTTSSLHSFNCYTRQLPTHPTSPELITIMFARRLAKSSSSLHASIRAFSASPAVFRAPALADITPEGVTSFDAKQKEFRERLAEQSKKKEPSQSSTSPPPTTSTSTGIFLSPTAPMVSNARTFF